MSTLRQAEKEIVITGKLLSDKGLIAGSDGNISVRLEDNNILITGSGVRKGSLSTDDLVMINSTGKKLKGSREPSSEMGMHLAVYENRQDINAIVHGHPPYVTSFAVTGEELPENILPEVVLFIGRIPLTDFAPPGTEAVAVSLKPHILECNAIMLRNHGLITFGRNCEEALNRHETVEHYAQIIILSKQIGSVDILDKQEINRLTKLRYRLSGRNFPDSERDC